VYVDLAVNLPLVSVDRIGIEQVITNLVRNAADAMEAQSGARAIWIATKLNVPTAGAANAIELVVRDSGPGLNGISLDTLCSTFYSTKQSGMGLGLGICRAIVESHGGRLTAQDAVHRGAEFRFTIPI
jgi:C4-dicarboxylate-specific signal transduction histidine kinase